MTHTDPSRIERIYDVQRKSLEHLKRVVKVEVFAEPALHRIPSTWLSIPKQLSCGAHLKGCTCMVSVTLHVSPGPRSSLARFEETQCPWSTANLLCVPFARGTAIFARLLLTLLQTVPAEALSAVFSTGNRESLSSTVLGTASRGHLLTPPSKVNTGEGSWRNRVRDTSR